MSGKKRKEARSDDLEWHRISEAPYKLFNESVFARAVWKFDERRSISGEVQLIDDFPETLYLSGIVVLQPKDWYWYVSRKKDII